MNCHGEWSRCFRIFVFAVSLLAVFPAVRGATITWTNTAGGNWSNPANWSPNQVPGQLNSTNNTDDAIIASTQYVYTVVFDVGSASDFWGVHSITVSGFELFSITSGTTLQASALSFINQGRFNNISSSIRGAITMGAGCQFNSFAGKYYGPVTCSGTATFNGDVFFQALTVNPGATITMSSDTVEYGGLTIKGKFNLQSGIFSACGPITNSGTLAFFNNGFGGNGIYLYNDATTNFTGGLVNLPGAVIALDNASNRGIQGFYGHEYFLNQGVLTGTNSGTVNVPTFDNTAGVITNWSGTLSLGKFTNAFAGFFYNAAGGIIKLNGGTAANPLAPANALSFNGGGIYQFISGYLRLTDNVIPNLQLSFGNLLLGPDFQGGAITNLTFDSMWLTNETLPVAGTLVMQGSTAQIFGNFTVLGGGSLTVNGGNLHGTLTVASNAIMNIGSATFAGDDWTTVNGTLNVTGYTYLLGLLTNQNTINVTGPLGIGNNGTSSHGGLVNEVGSVLNIRGNSAIQNAGGTNDFLVNHGSIIKLNDTNTASINVSSLTNFGSIFVPQGKLQLKHPELASSGSLNVRLNNQSDYGKIEITGAVAENGAFNVTLATNYIPGAGDLFQPLTYGSHTEAFTATNLPATAFWSVTNGPTALTLLVTAQGSVPVFTFAALADGNLTFNGTNGMPGNTYWILVGTNLAQSPANWIPVATNQFDSAGNFNFTNAVDPTQPQRFFILKPQ